MQKTIHGQLAHLLSLPKAPHVHGIMSTMMAGLNRKVTMLLVNSRDCLTGQHNFCNPTTSILA